MRSSEAPSPNKENSNPMKKLMTLMLGMAFAFTTVAVTFAQDAPKKDEKKEEKKEGKKKKKKEGEDEKKGGGQ